MDWKPGACAVAGIGATEFSKNSGRSVLALATEASLAAIDDAGLTLAAIDGTYRGRTARHAARASRYGVTSPRTPASTAGRW